MYFRIVWTKMSKKYINEYIIFCKNQNFRDKNNKTIIIMNSTTRSQSNWAIPEKNKLTGGGLKIWTFQGSQRHSMWNLWNFQELIKNKVEFQGWPRKNNGEFPGAGPGVLVSGLQIPKASNPTLWNFQKWSFALSWISGSKVKKMSSTWNLNQCPVFFWNSPLYIYNLVKGL